MSSRKIAVCLSGQVRTWESCYKNIQAFFSQMGDVDYFFHTWKYTEDRSSCRDSMSNYITTEVRPETIQDIKTAYRPKKYLWENDLKTKRELSQRYDRTQYALSSFCRSVLLKKEYEIENNFKYDIVFKTRFDVIFNLHKSVNDFLINFEEMALYSANSGRSAWEFMIPHIADMTYASSSGVMDLLTNIWNLKYDESNNPNLLKKPIFTYETRYDVLGPGTSVTRFCQEHNIKVCDDNTIESPIIRTHNPDIDPMTEYGFYEYQQLHNEWFKT